MSNLFVEYPSYQQIISWLITLIGGGAGGAFFSYFFNKWNNDQIAKAKEKGAISALSSEVATCRQLCNHNEKMGHVSIAYFVRFPTLVANNVTFVDRHSYPNLIPLQSRLESYTLALLQMNERIDLYKTITPLSKDIHSKLGTDRDDLRNVIAQICRGEKELEYIGLEDIIVLPKFIDDLEAQISKMVSSKEEKSIWKRKNMKKSD